MKYTGRNQAIFDLDRFSRHDMPGPFRMVIHKFSRYAETVESLPLLERMKLVLVTDFVVESFLPGNLPIMSIQLIGHADTDPYANNVSLASCSGPARNERTWSCVI